MARKNPRIGFGQGPRSRRRPQREWDWDRDVVSGLTRYSSRVVLPQFMPSNRPAPPVQPQVRGPRYSVDPTNPLGLRHDQRLITERQLLDLEAAGYVVLRWRTGMARLSAILRSVKSSHGDAVAFWCPGCDGCHVIYVGRPEGSGKPCWGYNGDPARPTFTPSILVTTGRKVDPAYVPDPDFPDPPECCHSFVTDGQIQFCGDSTHALAGQTVPLPEWHQQYGGTED